MIKLTIQTGFIEEIRLFDQAVILIGSSPQPAVDVCLNHPAIQPIHLKILNQQGKWVVINAVNDPFVAINGYPFGKKQLTSGDTIDLNSMTILFEETEDLREVPPETLDSNILLDRLEKKIGASPSLQLEAFPRESDNDLGLNVQQGKITQPFVEPIRTSLKDSHIGDSGEEKETWYPESNVSDEEPVSASPSRPQEWFIVGLILLLAFIAIWSTWEYLSYSRKVAKEEIETTKGLADVAMALTHAQLHHHQPNNHNWTDDDFLKTHLVSTVPDPHHLIASGDIQHFFYKNSYTLRIYTSNDLSQFLLIAQPISTFWHWMLPQATIVIDSISMEIRKMEDLRPLNRLLAHVGPLGREEMEEISHLIKHADLVPLKTLAKNLKTKDFLPPASLAKTHPGAEHRIYNAPRYHRLSTPLINALERIHLNQGTAADIDFVKKETKALATLPNLILYAHENKKSAELIKQGLIAFSSDASSLRIGWFSLNQRGDVDCCGLADHSETPKRASIKFHENKLYDKLKNLQKTREAALEHLSSQLINLIKAGAEKPVANFVEHYTELSHQFLRLSEKQNQLMKQAVKKLYGEFQGSVSPIEFISLAKEIGVHDLDTTEIGKDWVINTRFRHLLNRQWPFPWEKDVKDINDLIQL